jgi:hypothetical protein
MIYYTYPKAILGLLKADLDFDGTIKALLLTSSISGGYDSSHQYVSSLTGEVTGGSYARQTVSVTVSSDTEKAYVTPTASISFPGVPGSVQYVVFYVDGINDGARSLIGIIDLGVTSVGGTNLQIDFIGNLIEGYV